MGTDERGKSKGIDKRIGKKPVIRRKVGQSWSAEASYTLLQAFEVFYQAKSSERLRELTLRDYRRHFGYLMCWLTERHPELHYLSQFTPHIVREYVYFLSYEKQLYKGHPFKENKSSSRRGLSARAVNVRINTLKAMFRWFYREGMISDDPTRNLSRQKTP